MRRVRGVVGIVPTFLSLSRLPSSACLELALCCLLCVVRNRRHDPHEHSQELGSYAKLCESHRSTSPGVLPFRLA
jgi:hypothetical protein